MAAEVGDAYKFHPGAHRFGRVVEVVAIEGTDANDVVCFKDGTSTRQYKLRGAPKLQELRQSYLYAY